MLKFKKEMIENLILETFICDKCKKEIAQDDEFELQETYSINLIGGYTSVFGDMVEVRCDLCQDCLKELIEDFCRYPDESEE